LGKSRGSIGTGLAIGNNFKSPRRRKKAGPRSEEAENLRGESLD